MTDHSITSLIEKLEGAEVGSNALSDQVLSACGYVETRFPMDSCPYWVHPSAPKTVLSVSQESVTTSLDAALALAERVLDQRGPININICLAGSAQVIIDSVGPCDPRMAQVVARTPALALCAAVLSAQSEAR